MALPRVYDIAKELGIDSKVALEKLAELGELVKSGSTAISPGAARKLREAFSRDRSGQVSPVTNTIETQAHPAPSHVNELLISGENNWVAKRFTLLNKVGIGGLSEVFKGFDNETDTRVAVKVLGELDAGLSRALWKKEVEGLSKLSHQNIVKILDSCVKVTGEGEQYWIVLEWLEETLSERYARGTYRFEPNSWMKYSLGLISGLSHAHQHNVAHRDIKPDNLLFRKKDDEDRQVVIADFGISKNIDNETDTRTVADFGSMVFSPPDHASRDPFSRDVYSAAAILVQLTSVVLFRDTLDLQNALEACNLPTGFRTLLKDALDLDPENRPKNMVEFKVRFDKLLEPYRQKRQGESPPALPVPVKFTNKPLEQLIGSSLADFARAKTKFESLIRGQDLYAQLLAAGKDQEDPSARVSICTDQWVFTFILKRDEKSAPYLLLVRAAEPDFDTLERYRFGSKNVGRSYSLSAYDSRQVLPAGRGIDALESELQRHSPAPVDSASEPGSFESWSRVLDAREELVRGSYKPMEFTSVRIESGTAIFNVNSEIESDITDTSWEVTGFRGVFFEVTSFDGTTVWTRPSRDLGTLAQRGQLVPSLGRDAVSLSRQRTAVLSFKNGDETSKGIGLAVASPSEAISVSAISDITPVIEGLDKDKIAAVRDALASDDVFVVQGPPGTGKTNFIAELVHQIKRRDPKSKVLLVAQTHVAVDNAILRLEKSGYKDMLRIGDASDPRLHPEALKYLVDKKIKEWIEKIRLSAESDLKTRAGIEGQGLEQLKALALVSELNAARKQSAYLDAKTKMGTTAFEESVNDEEESQVQSAVASNSLWQEGLRNKLEILSPGVAKRERELDDVALDEFVREWVTKFPNPDLLIKLLEVQSGWLLKVHTDVDLRLRFLSDAGLVAGTCIGFLREPAVREMEFDYCIVDEASKATATETLVPMSKARRAILVGDSNQLPPNDEELLENSQIMSNHGLVEADIRTTLFDILRNRLPGNKSTSLVTQWRMSRPIGDLISECFYEGKLESVNDGQIPGYDTLIGAQVRWLDTSDHPKRMEYESKGGGFTNPVEARVIANEVVRLSKAIISRHLKVDPDTFEILIVSPYRAQKRTILNELQVRDYGNVKVRVETADAVQGSEADVVIVATTRSNNRGKLGFLGMAQWRRINVALSRAKFGLIIVGDSGFIGSTQGGLSKALDYIGAHPGTCTMEKVSSNV